VPPITILREQAKYLEQTTRGVLSTSIETTSSQTSPYSDVIDLLTRAQGANRPAMPSGDGLFHSFYVVAPALNDYRFQLLRIWHTINLYPVLMAREKAPAKWDVAHDQPEFLEKLKAVFSHDDTVRVVRALISQSRS